MSALRPHEFSLGKRHVLSIAREPPKRLPCRMSAEVLDVALNGWEGSGDYCGEAANDTSQFVFVVLMDVCRGSVFVLVADCTLSFLEGFNFGETFV